MTNNGVRICGGDDEKWRRTVTSGHSVEKNDRGYAGGETISGRFKWDVTRLVNLPSGRGVV